MKASLTVEGVVKPHGRLNVLHAITVDGRVDPWRRYRRILLKILEVFGKDALDDDGRPRMGLISFVISDDREIAMFAIESGFSVECAGDEV
jgi:hypothetical protein